MNEWVDVNQEVPPLSESALAHMNGEDHNYGMAWRERESQLREMVHRLPRWISVGDTGALKPSGYQDASSETVWLYKSRHPYAGHYGVGHYDYEDGAWSVFGFSGEPTHWMPLPQPPPVQKMDKSS